MPALVQAVPRNLIGLSRGEVNLPVVESRETMRMIGAAQEHEVVLAYHRALDRARGEERGGE